MGWRRVFIKLPSLPMREVLHALDELGSRY